MNLFFHSKRPHGQTALEYLLLVTVVAIIVIGGFRFVYPHIHDSSEGYYNKVTTVIMGGHYNDSSTFVPDNPKPISGGWCPVQCAPPGSCGSPVLYRRCECPSPAFGGTYCPGSAQVNCSGVKTCVACAPAKDNDGNIICDAPTPPASCGQATHGLDTCGNFCQKITAPCGVCGNGNPAPANTKDCSQDGVDSQDGVNAGTSWKIVAECTGAKCEVQCKSGTTPDPTKTSCK
jgi:Flp pilus assembly pilin Flp